MMDLIMRARLPFFLMAFISSVSCLELKIEVDADSIAFPQWISGTIKVKNNESRVRSVSMEESQPDIFLSQDTAIKVRKVTDFGPDSPVSLEPGVSALWCFMAEIPGKYFKSKPKGPHKISLTMRQFGAEAKSKPFVLWLPGTVSDKNLELASMKNLVNQLSQEEINALVEATKRIAFSGMHDEQVDPRVLFWKYRLRHAAFMKDLRRMPICENCFRMPVTLYWSIQLWEWCSMFYWNTPRCAENELRIQTMLVSRLGNLEEKSANEDSIQVVRTEIGKFAVSRRQIKMLRGGGLKK